MDYNGIVSFVCATVSKTDSYSQLRCMDFVTARDRMIYESADWKTAQIIVEKTIAAGGGTVTSQPASEVHHALSVRLDGRLLDPVSASYIFESATGPNDQYLTPGTPLFFDEFYDQ